MYFDSQFTNNYGAIMMHLAVYSTYSHVTRRRMCFICRYCIAISSVYLVVWLCYKCIWHPFCAPLLLVTESRALRLRLLSYNILHAFLFYVQYYCSLPALCKAYAHLTYISQFTAESDYFADSLCLFKQIRSIYYIPL